MKEWDVYFITDSGTTRKSDIEDVRSALKAGVKIVQYRDKNALPGDMEKKAVKIGEMCREAGAAFIVNDKADIELKTGADGIHIGQNDIPLKDAREKMGDKIIGVTVHSEKEAEEAEAGGADYIAVSPVYATGTKKDAGRACGTEMIEKIRKKSLLPIVAIGGITGEKLGEVVSAGADSVAMISAIVAKENVEMETKKLRKKIIELKRR